MSRGGRDAHVRAFVCYYPLHLVLRSFLKYMLTQSLDTILRNVVSPQWLWFASLSAISSHSSHCRYTTDAMHV